MNIIGNVRIRDQIIKVVRENILSGAYAPGTRLAQEELAGQLGVSRIPVREALQILEEQGLLKRLPSRHMVVAELEREHLYQIYDIIANLEAEYCRLIIEGGKDAHFLEKLDCCDKKSAMAFHQIVAESMDNEYLSRQLKNMLDTYVEYASGLSGQEAAEMQMRLSGICEALKKPADWSVIRSLFQEYYEQLGKNLMEERNRHTW